MRRRIARFRLPLVLAILGAGCQSVTHDLTKEVTADATPAMEPGPEQRDLSVPTLEERREGDQFLSRIAALNQQIKELQELNLKIEKDTSSSRTELAMSREREAKLAEENGRLQTLLGESTDRERDLREEILRVRLENVRLKQEINRAKMRELQAGAGN